MIAATTLDRAELLERYRRNRARTAQLFATIHDDAFYDRPIPLRHPFAFYEGHIPAFSYSTLNIRGLGEPPIDPVLERLFERGIDPSTIGEAQRHDRSDWPHRRAVAAFAQECDARVQRALASAPIDNPEVPSLVRAQAAFTILEHENMHQETLMYIVHQLDVARKAQIRGEHADSPMPAPEMRAIPAGIATLGADREELAFGWDNEFERCEVAVPAFEIARYPLTNGDWLRFVADGGPVPQFWNEDGGAWRLRLMFEEIPLPRSWPVHVTQQQAGAYAAWAGMRLPSEAEYHRAAFGTPSGEERPLPWGAESPGPRHGNFDFQRWDPEPVDAHPQGASAFGIEDLVGNGWEWTSTPFGPFPGFAPMAAYPRYSADFFDGRHYVMKGGCAVTSRELIRRSFRNWFYADYPYMFAKFRCVAAR